MMNLNDAIAAFVGQQTTGNLLNLIMASFDDSAERLLPDYSDPQASIIFDAVKDFDQLAEVGQTKAYVLERVVRYYSFTREGLFFTALGGDVVDPIDLQTVFEVVRDTLGANHVVTARAFVLAVSCARDPMYVFEDASPSVLAGLSQLFDGAKYYLNDGVGDRTDDFVGDDTLAATRAYLVKAMHSKSTENYADARVYYERGIHATVTAANKPGYMQLREPSALEDVNATGRRLRWGLVETLTALGETDVARHEMFEAFMHERNNAGKLRIGESYRRFVSWCLSKPNMIAWHLETKLDTIKIRCRDIQGLACFFLFKARESNAPEAEAFLDLAVKYWAKPMAQTEEKECSGESLFVEEMIIWYRHLNKNLLQFMSTVHSKNVAAKYDKLVAILGGLEEYNLVNKATGETVNTLAAQRHLLQSLHCILLLSRK